MEQSSGIPAPPHESKAHLSHILGPEPSPPPPPPQLSHSVPDVDQSFEGATPSSSLRKKAERETPSQNKMRFLKKDDGTPFWRRDIQHNLLNLIFNNDQRVFTDTDDRTNAHSFADIYIRAMANSSKCSNLLRDKLLSNVVDPNVIPPRDMAMVCLLVNVGRMNTTVNFFPEMKARVRTFHSIPSLQAKQGQSASKQLQDGPRLKSILKGCQEDTAQPMTLHDLCQTPKPRLNPVSLVFLLANFAPKISESHFPEGYEFFDIFMRDTLSSESRARAFLWLVWWYLESDFTAEDARNNPFGPGTPGDDPKDRSIVPDFVTITEEEAAAENEDPPVEVEFGEQKRVEREMNLAADEAPSSANRGKPEKHLERAAPSNTEQRGSSPPLVESSNERPPDQAMDAIRNRWQSSEHKSIDGNRSPMLAPAPRFTAANNLPAPPSSHLSNRTPSGSPSGELRLPKLKPNLSQLSNESMRSNESTPNEPTRSARLPPEPGHHLSPPYDASMHSGTNDHSVHHSPHQDTIESSSAAVHHSHQSPLPSAPLQIPSYFSHFPQAASPQISRHVDDTIFSQDNGIVPPPYPTQPDRRPSSKQRPAQPLTQEQTRHGKAEEMVSTNLYNLIKRKRQERKRRGVVLDAWVKARSVPSGWDSEEDEFQRMGGIDDVRNDSGIMVTIRSGDGSEKSVRWDVGDAGQQAADLSHDCRRLGRTLASLSQPRVPRQSGSRKRKAHSELERERSHRQSTFPPPPSDSETKTKYLPPGTVNPLQSSQPPWMHMAEGDPRRPHVFPDGTVSFTKPYNTTTLDGKDYPGTVSSTKSFDTTTLDPKDNPGRDLSYKPLPNGMFEIQTSIGPMEIQGPYGPTPELAAFQAAGPTFAPVTQSSQHSTDTPVREPTSAPFSASASTPAPPQAPSSRQGSLSNPTPNPTPGPQSSRHDSITDPSPSSLRSPIEKTYTWTPKGRKRKSSAVDGGIAAGSRPGEIGMPLGAWRRLGEGVVVVESEGLGRRRRSSALTRGLGGARGSVGSLTAGLREESSGEKEGEVGVGEVSAPVEGESSVPVDGEVAADAPPAEAEVTAVAEAAGEPPGEPSAGEADVEMAEA